MFHTLLELLKSYHTCTQKGMTKKTLKTFMIQSDLRWTLNPASSRNLFAIIYSQLMVPSFPPTCNPSYSHMPTIRPTRIATGARISHCPQQTLNTDAGCRLTETRHVCVCVWFFLCVTAQKHRSHWGCLSPPAADR